MKPGDRLFCLFTEPFEVGYTFKTWPLHLTLITWFHLEDEHVADDLTLLLNPLAPTRIEAAKEGEHFGHQPGKLATVVVLKPELVRLEQVLRQYLKSHGAWLVDETTKIRRDFMPHITERGPQKVHRGDSFVCDRVYVIEQLGGIKQIQAVVQLGTSSFVTG